MIDIKKNENCLTVENTILNEVFITQKQYNDILNIQKTILNMIAKREYYKDILDKLCNLAETLLPNSVASIMVKDKTTGLLNVFSAPSMPKEGVDALKNLKPGPGGGSCANAIYKNEPQFVKDTFHDSRWNDIRQIAYDFNLCSCWSMPIRDDKNLPIGSFALSSFEHRTPLNFHKMLLETGANIVSIVLINLQNEKRIKSLQHSIENAKEGVIITNKENKIIEVNKSFEQIYGYRQSEVLGKNPKIFSSGLYAKEFYKKMWSDLYTKGNWHGEIINVDSKGKKITQWVSISLIYDESGEANYLAIFSDLTELKKAQEKINYLAYHDNLTRLENKSKLRTIIFNDNLKYSIIHIDINNIGYMNTSYGFEFGDKVLKEVAKTISKEFNTFKVFRVGSDEFALLYENDIDLEFYIKTIQKYFYENSYEIDNVILHFSFNYGACRSNVNLLEKAALSLKISKEMGKNRYYIFDNIHDKIKQEDKNRFISSNILIHKAIKHDCIIPYFQGMRDNKTKIIDKYEVLVRIQKNDKTIPPSEFLEVAKLSGLLPEITKIMIDKSFKIMQKRDECFSINITEDDLSRHYLLDYLRIKTDEYDINPNRVGLEILENVSQMGKRSHISQLNKLKSDGYLLIIDDFGAEYSNFERVLDLDIDVLKIDAKYIKNIDKDKKSYEIAKSIAYFTKSVDIVCVAEFVCSKEIQKIVEELGIEFSQGFYFSKPKML